MASSKRKHFKNKPRTVSELQKAVEKRITSLGTRRNEYEKAFYTHYHKRYLLAFARFIDNPHCYNNQLHDLYYCQSEIGGLQQRQRVSCVKMADYFFVDAVYVLDEDVLSNPDGFCDEDVPRVYSKAAYKTLTQKFMNIFGLQDNEDVQKSYLEGVYSRVKQGLSTAWIVYEAFSNSYFWNKRNRPKLKRGNDPAYPQGRDVKPSIYGANYLTEH